MGSGATSSKSRGHATLPVEDDPEGTDARSWSASTARRWIRGRRWL